MAWFLIEETGALREQIEAVERTQDAPAPGRLVSDWPYPDEHAVTDATGELAVRLRVALGVPQDATVQIRERIQHQGYSEYTQEHFRTVTVQCGHNYETFDGYAGGDNALEQMLAWLDEKAPVEVRRFVGGVPIG